MNREHFKSPLLCFSSTKKPHATKFYKNLNLLRNHFKLTGGNVRQQKCNPVIICNGGDSGHKKMFLFSFLVSKFCFGTGRATLAE